MTPVRAQHIIAYCQTPMGAFFYTFEKRPGCVIHPDGISEREDFFIQTLWQTLPDDASYWDTVMWIAQGKPTPWMKI